MISAPHPQDTRGVNDAPPIHAKVIKSVSALTAFVIRDITSDISVLSSMLAGEGLIGNQFQREVKGEI